MSDFVIHPETKIGHVHLKVADIERSLQFYRDLLGFALIDCYKDDDGEVAFLSAGGYHHHIGLNTWYSAGGTPPPAGHTGLFHTAILFPSRKELAKILKRVIDAGYNVKVMDHGVSEAIYIDDPDQNGVELYADKPKEAWPRDDHGAIVINGQTRRIDPESILSELNG